MRWRRNVDEDRRSLERRAATGDLEAESRLLSLRVRTGELVSGRIMLAAFLGHSASLLLYPNPAKTLGRAGVQLTSIYNYQPPSIGVMPVDLAIRGLHDRFFLPSIGLDFIIHAIPPYGLTTDAGSAIQDLIHAIQDWLRVAPQSIVTIENAWSHWRPDQSRDEFYAEHREIDQAITQEQNAVTAVRMADPYASNMELVGPLDQIRWAVVSISRDIWNSGNLTNSHLAVIAAADYCRMAAGDFTLATVNEHMRQEGEWQAQHLIHRLLET